MSEQIIIAEAINQYAAGNIDRAEDLFRQALSMNPALADAFYFLGIIASTKGVLSEACRLLYQASLLQPYNTDYSYSLAVALQESGKIDEAVAIYEKIPQLAESQNNLGNIYLAQGDFEKAEKCFDQALEIDKKMIWALVNKAILLRQKNDVQDAEKMLLNALKINEKFIPALYQLSIVYRQKGKLGKALDTIKKAADLPSVPDFVWVEYGKVLKDLQKKDQALNAFEKAIEQNRFCEDAYFEKAELLEDKNPDEAEKAYRDVIRINPHHAAAYNNLGTLLYDNGRVSEALEMYRQVVILNPADPLASFNLAVALEDLGDFEGAAGLYFNVLAHQSYEKQAHIRLANVLPKLYEKNPKEALNYAEGWVKNFADNPFAVHTLAALKNKPDTEQNDYAYAVNLYDAFADSYDDKMQELACDIPLKIAEKLKGQHFKNVLDLGCGTGLSGLALAPLSDKITGVDASQSMIEKAKEKGVYASLVVADIMDFLTDNKTKYDLIVAADVFCYINDLSPIFEAVSAHLKKGGTFIFTIEKALSDKTEIMPYGRYRHVQAQVQKSLETWGFKGIQSQQIDLRKEGTSFCQGILFMCSY